MAVKPKLTHMILHNLIFAHQRDKAEKKIWTNEIIINETWNVYIR